MRTVHHFTVFLSVCAGRKHFGTHPTLEQLGGKIVRSLAMPRTLLLSREFSSAQSALVYTGKSALFVNVFEMFQAVCARSELLRALGALENFADEIVHVLAMRSAIWFGCEQFGTHATRVLAVHALVEPVHHVPVLFEQAASGKYLLAHLAREVLSERFIHVVDFSQMLRAAPFRETLTAESTFVLVNLSEQAIFAGTRGWVTEASWIRVTVRVISTPLITPHMVNVVISVDCASAGTTR